MEANEYGTSVTIPECKILMTVGLTPYIGVSDYGASATIHGGKSPWCISHHTLVQNITVGLKPYCRNTDKT